MIWEGESFQKQWLIIFNLIKKSFVFSSFILTTFDDSKCSWTKSNQTNCNQFITSQQTLTTSLTQSTSFSLPTKSPTTTLTANTPNHLNKEASEKSDKITSAPEKFGCDLNDLSSNWKCSNGSNHHSRCIQVNSNGQIEHKRCYCRKKICSWTPPNSKSEMSKPKTPTSLATASQATGKTEKSSLDLFESFIDNLKLINNGDIRDINLDMQLR